MVTATAPIVVDWEPAIRELLDDVAGGEGAGLVSAKFHNGLVEAAVDVAKKIGESKIVLSGGCFQNRYLTERIVERLREENFRPTGTNGFRPMTAGFRRASAWRQAKVQK